MKSIVAWVIASFCFSSASAAKLASESSQIAGTSAESSELAGTSSWSASIYHQLLEEHVHGEGKCRPPEMQGHIRNVTQTDLEKTLNLPTSHHQPFAFIRLGDGDVLCMGHGGGSNIEGMQYDYYKKECDEFSMALQDIGSQDDTNFYVLVGEFFLCNPQIGKLWRNFLQTHPLQPSFKGFMTEGFYVHLEPAPRPAKMPSTPMVFPSLVNRKVVVMGPKFLQQLNHSLNMASYINTHDAAHNVHGLVADMRRESKKYPNDNVVFLVAGGFGGRLAIYLAWKELGHKDTFVDVGASLDGLAGQVSRSFNSKGHTCSTIGWHAAPGVCDGY